MDISPDILVKARTKSKDVFNRIGHRAIYMTLLEIGCYNGTTTGNMNAIKTATFEDAIFNISIYNGGN